VRGATTQDGQECLIVHWWDHGEEDNTVMTRKHAASLGANMRSLITAFDEQQSTMESSESSLQEPSRPLAGQLSLLHLNGEGGCPAQM
jgi:hypothetical protein